MPNWCTTEIDFFGKDAGRLSSKIEEFCQKEFESGFGKYWLGKIVAGLGYDPTSLNAPRCRGEIFDHQMHDDHLHISTETAWEPMLRLWLELIQKFHYDVEIIYRAEEPGCCIYDTNDPDLDGKYHFEMEDIYDDLTEEDLKTKLTSMCNKYNLPYSKEDDIQSLENIVNDYLDDNDEWMSIEKWRFAEPKEWA